MTDLDAALLGLVEGLTEFLPVSSTGHLMIAARLLGYDSEEAFPASFNIIIQFGAILAVVVLYWRRLLVDKDVMLRVGVAFIPTGILGFLLYKVVKEVFLKEIRIVLWSLFLGGIVLIVFELLHGERKQAVNDLKKIPLWKAAVIGVFQALAMIPGVSRSAATVVGGLTLGIDRRTSVEFAFLLAVPTMLVATGYDLYKSGHAFSADQWQVLAIGFAVSFVVGMAAVVFMLRFVKTHTFVTFGVYRIAAALLFGWWFYWR
jgi:undecaprenyl-diphosphatase